MADSPEAVARHMLLADVRRMPWARGLKAETLAEIVATAEFVTVSEGEFIHRANQVLGAVHFCIRGRFIASVEDLFGKNVLERSLGRGTCFGLFSIGQSEDDRITIQASEPSHLLKLGFADLHRLTAKYEAFQLNLYRIAGEQVRQMMNLDRKKVVPREVGMVHHRGAFRGLTGQLVRRLSQLGEKMGVLSDDPSWEPVDGVDHHPLTENGHEMDQEARRALLQKWTARHRVFVDLSTSCGGDGLARMMRFADVVLWCVRPEDATEARSLLTSLEASIPGCTAKVLLVWCLGDEKFAPHDPALLNLAERQFVFSPKPPPKNRGRQLNLGLERLLHQLRGVRIGLALGGGAARGMAHLGVIKALEEKGIFIDMLAGTSAGAMTGTLYASGMDLDHATQSFKKDLSLPWFFRILPGGGYWYLLGKYRWGQFDSMLRCYLGDVSLDQLPIPICTVAVDLVSSSQVVRTKEDAVRSILESINLPGLSSPILGEEKALVDGGLVNNIPADILVARGCNFVIASSVTAKLEKEFSGIGGGGGKASKPSTLQTLLRGQLVQSHNMNSVGINPADVVVAPDVTGFELSAFGLADEMAKVGYEAGLEMSEHIWRLLGRLDAELFPSRSSVEEESGRTAS